MIELLDFRAITRDSDRVNCTVLLGQDPWITCGEVSLQEPTRKGIRFLRAYLRDGATDSEHDSAYAFILPLYGVQFQVVEAHSTVLSAIVAPREEGLMVPSRAYNPFLGAPLCKKCERPHAIVPYTPDLNPELYQQVSGQHVEIYIRPCLR